MPRLLLKEGAGPGQIELTAETLTVGRRPDNRLRLDDNFASARHCSFSLRSGAFWIEDHNSSNGTFLNGARIDGLKRLKHGDRVGVGRQQYEFFDEAEPAGATPVGSPAVAKSPAPLPAVAARDPLPEKPTRPVIGVAPPTPATDVGKLDALVGSIRSHRERERAAKEAFQAQVREQWQKTLAYAEQLKEKVGKDPRVKYFSVSRRANDVMIRFQRDPSSAVQMLYLSLEHPEEKNHALQGIWFRRSGAADRCMQSADEVATELVSEVAFLIA
jgi:pSer/pThr/pTyr-binding forkhead associated (FHA) protein